MSEGSQWVIGFHAVRAALKRRRQTAELWVDCQRRDPRVKELLALAHEADVKVHQASGDEMGRMAQGAQHQGVMARIRTAQVHDEAYLKALIKRMDVAPLLLILDGVQDPHNLGACLRTAEAAGVQAVITPRDRSVGLNTTVHKVASGAADLVPLVRVTNLVRTMQWLKQAGLWLIGTAGEAEQSIYQTDLLGPLAIVMGGEGKGLRRLTREQCDRLVALPMLGSVESLNVSVATGVALYEAVRQRLV